MSELAARGLHANPSATLATRSGTTTCPPTGLEVLAGLAVSIAVLVLGLGILYSTPAFLASWTAFEIGAGLTTAIAPLGFAVPILLRRRRLAFQTLGLRPAPFIQYVYWIPSALLLPYVLSQAVLISARLMGHDLESLTERSLDAWLEFIGIIPTVVIWVGISAPTFTIAYFGVILPWLRRRLPIVACALVLVTFDVALMVFDGHVAGIAFWASATILQTFAWHRTRSLYLLIAMSIGLDAMQIVSSHVVWTGI